MVLRIILTLFIVKCSFAEILNVTDIPTHWTYRAAVYEHRPIVLKETSRVTITETLDVYEQQIKLASEQDARIIVFPEYGIFGLSLNRTQIYPFLEIVPDPFEEFINPCINTVPTSRNTIQRRLSCAARWYNIYIVANFGSVVFCNQASETCPSDGRYQYNTNVVFDCDGLIVARYHKQNLYYENQFDVPPKVEYSVFGSPLGTFGTFTCFDMLFKEPVLMLLESIGVVNIAFATAWINVLPEMFAIGVQESFAVRMGVNLLAANLHIPEIDEQGSGIYSGNDGAISYYNSNRFLSSGKLFIANVTTPPKRPPEGNVSMPSLHKGILMKDNFTALMEKNVFTFVTLDNQKLSDEIFLEVKDTKCYLNYTLKETNSQDLFAFGIFDGLHKSSLNSYIQVCALIKCANASKYSCGQGARTSTTSFKTVTLKGQFSSHYIFPSMLFEDANPSKKDWEFLLDKNSFRAEINTASSSDMKPLLATILYTRLYDKDNNTYTNSSVKMNSKKYSKKPFEWKAESTGDMETRNMRNNNILLMISVGILGIACASIIVMLVYQHHSDSSRTGYTRL